jgi:hypothetical protein
MTGRSADPVLVPSLLVILAVVDGAFAGFRAGRMRRRARRAACQGVRHGPIPREWRPSHRSRAGRRVRR